MFNFLLNFIKKDKNIKNSAKFGVLQKQAERVIEQLEKIPKDFCPKEQKELFKMAKESVNPTLRKLRPFIKGGAALKDQEVLAYQKFKKRLNQAEKQICVLQEAECEKKKKEAFFKQSVKRVLGCIDRDIKLLSQYCAQFQEQRGCVYIEPYLQELSALKSAPNSLTLKQLPLWKERLAKERSRLFNEALEVLDQLRS